MVFAAVERGGEARTAVVASASAMALDPLMFKQLLSGCEANMVNLSYFPKPIVVQIDHSAFLDDAIRCPVEKCVADLLVVVASMVGDAINFLSQRMDRRRPRLRNIVGQAGMCDLGGCTDARKAWTC
jgi:hypothetical protein